MTEEQRNERIHSILYSTDSREELAQRIVALEELCAEMFADIDGLLDKDVTTVANSGGAMWLLCGSDVDAYRNRMRELRIEVSE